MIRELGGKKISPLGLGTFGFGGRMEADTRNDARDVGAIKYAISRGINFIDTAEMYSAGHSEELVGQAIRDYRRDDVFIITKVWSDHLGHDDLIKAAKKSLKRLDTDYIDLYLIHWPSSTVPIGESVHAMEELADQGLVRSIGVSNFSPEQLQEAMDSTTGHQIIANQIPYSVGDRSHEKDIIPFCEKSGVTVIGYSPLSRGDMGSSRAVGEIAEELGKSRAAVSLNYLMRRSVPIPKATTKEHIDDLAGAMGFELTDEQYRAIAEE